MKKTLIVQIGNSDNELTQAAWSQFAWELKSELEKAGNIHFFGGSDGLSPYQNCCIVMEISDEFLKGIKKKITMIRRNYRQISAAIVVGQVEFI